MVHRCLEKSPEQRFQSASDLAFALEASSDSGVSGTTSGPAPVRANLANGSCAYAGLVAVLTLAACAYFFVMRRERAPRLGISEYTQLTHDGHTGEVRRHGWEQNLSGQWDFEPHGTGCSIWRRD